MTASTQDLEKQANLRDEAYISSVLSHFSNNHYSRKSVPDVIFNDRAGLVEMKMPSGEWRTFKRILLMADSAIDPVNDPSPDPAVSTGFKAGAYVEMNAYHSPKPDPVTGQVKLRVSFPGWIPKRREDDEAAEIIDMERLPMQMAMVKPFVEKAQEVAKSEYGIAKPEWQLSGHSIGTANALWAKHLIEKDSGGRSIPAMLLEPVGTGVTIRKMSELLAGDEGVTERNRIADSFTENVTSVIVTPKILMRDFKTARSELNSAALGEELYCVAFPETQEYVIDLTPKFWQLFSPKNPATGNHFTSNMAKQLTEENTFLKAESSSEVCNEPLYTGSQVANAEMKDGKTLRDAVIAWGLRNVVKPLDENPVGRVKEEDRPVPTEAMLLQQVWARHEQVTETLIAEKIIQNAQRAMPQAVRASVIESSTKMRIPAAFDPTVHSDEIRVDLEESNGAYTLTIDGKKHHYLSPALEQASHALNGSGVTMQVEKEQTVMTAKDLGTLVQLMDRTIAPGVAKGYNELSNNGIASR